jgi:hypothetical protein
MDGSKGRIVEDFYCAVAMSQKEVSGRVCIGEAGLICLERLRVPGQNIRGRAC